MKKVLTEIAILIMAIIVFPLTAVIGMFYTFIKHVIRWDYIASKQLAPIVRSLSLALDGFANAAAGEMLTDMFLTQKTKYKYSNWNETISAITGFNAKYKTLSKRGKKFRKIVDSFFTKVLKEKGSHVINATKDNKK